MKILIIVNEFPPDIIAGTAMSTTYLAKYLSKRGNDVHIAVTMRNKESPPLEKQNGVTVHRFEPLQIRGTRLLQRFVYLYRLVRTLAPDVIQGQAVSCGMLASLLGRLLKKPTVTYIQGYDLYHANRLQRMTEVKIPLRLSSTVLTVSEDLRQKSMEVFPRRDAMVMPHGLETEDLSGSVIEKVREKYPFLSKNRIILYVGQLIRRKGLPHLIEAMNIVREKVGNVKLLLIGQGADKDSLQDLVRQRNLTEQVLFLGAEDHEHVLAFMNVSDLFVLPSLEEAFGIVLVEAMSQGLPVVATDVQGVPSIVRDGVNGYLVPPRDEKALAARIISLLENARLAKEMGERNRMDSAQYRWEYLAERYMDIYERIRTIDGTGRNP
ncbi:MAG: glycosyltransferase family 4 protein [Deltaproteobacteria bacterium]|nr:glycosyltransferase family 4 protein [Deltaproteobacteria bacterium]